MLDADPPRLTSAAARQIRSPPADRQNSVSSRVATRREARYPAQPFTTPLGSRWTDPSADLRQIEKAPSASASADPSGDRTLHDLDGIVADTRADILEEILLAADTPTNASRSLDPRDTQFAITVSDDGPGISDTILPRLFQRFSSDRERGHGHNTALRSWLVCGE